MSTDKFDESEGEVAVAEGAEPSAHGASADSVAELHALAAGLHDNFSLNAIHELLGAGGEAAERADIGFDAEFSQQSPYDEPVFAPDEVPAEADTRGEQVNGGAHVHELPVQIPEPAAAGPDPRATTEAPPIPVEASTKAVPPSAPDVSFREVLDELLLLRRALDRDSGAATILVRTLDQELGEFRHLMHSMQNRLDTRRAEPMDPAVLQSTLEQLSSRSQVLTDQAAALDVQFQMLREVVAERARADTTPVEPLEGSALQSAMTQLSIHSQSLTDRAAALDDQFQTLREAVAARAHDLDDRIEQLHATVAERAHTLEGRFLALHDSAVERSATLDAHLRELEAVFRAAVQDRPTLPAGQPFDPATLEGIIENAVADRLMPLVTAFQSVQGSTQHFDQSLLESAQRVESLQRAVEALVDTSPDVRPLAQALKLITERVNALHVEFGEPIGALRELLFDAQESNTGKLSSLEERLMTFVVLHDEVSAQLTRVESQIAEAGRNHPPRTTENLFFGLALFLLLVNIAMNVWWRVYHQ